MAAELGLDGLQSLARYLEREPQLRCAVWVRLARREARGNLVEAMIEELAQLFADETVKPPTDAELRSGLEVDDARLEPR